MPGKTSTQYDDPGATPLSRNAPTAQTSGPTVIGRRGPAREASTENLEDKNSITTGIGRVAAPAATASYPTVTCSCSTRKNSTAPSAPYTSSVIRFAAENTRDRNSDSGTMAPARRSSTTKPPQAASATATPVATTTSEMSRQAVRRYVVTPRATTPTSAPGTSKWPV